MFGLYWLSLRARNNQSTTEDIVGQAMSMLQEFGTHRRHNVFSITNSEAQSIPQLLQKPRWLRPLHVLSSLMLMPLYMQQTRVLGSWLGTTIAAMAKHLPRCASACYEGSGCHTRNIFRATLQISLFYH